MVTLKHPVVCHLGETKEAVISLKDIDPTFPIGAHDRLDDSPVHTNNLSKICN